MLQLAKNPAFEKTYLICNSWTLQNFKNEQPNLCLIPVDDTQNLPLMIQALVASLKNQIVDTEAAVNLYSGTGKEHMAILAALLKLGLGIRLVTVQNDQVVEL